jgi:hypothetical protein
MLTYSSHVWRLFLNPSSNLNRFRLPDYEKVFEKCFQRLEIDVLERLENEFQAVRPRIRPEFKTGAVSTDSVTQIQIMASEPLPQAQ